ncbi:uncharacterized protein LOC114291677 [Camellia sinensis]|uniref:uncharacterized protein LOC114291677 n=1 Tax=Camellia sinensis TaxID=4442 RepID=UPI001036B7F2|nr:uncharacterized protein LOC114291677 [Camellia sinensis]
MDSSGDNVDNKDSKDSEDSKDNENNEDNADSKDSGDNIASHVRSSFIALDNDDIDFEMDCIGAIDGTHIAAHAPTRKRSVYRGRKVAITQNILAACSFDMKFTFVYPSWEGSVIDSRVLSNALTRPDVAFPLPLTGKYYLVDTGYTNMIGFLAPYHSKQYHLDQFRGCRHQPNGYKELFNYHHSSLRNVIERCFGVLKNHFPILKSMPNYMQVRQGTCCACHNRIRMHFANDPWFNRQTEHATPMARNSNLEDEVMNEMVQFRDEIVTAMWNNRKVHP